MTLTTIEPVHASALIKSGALLIDIREADEHAREKISRARNIPLSGLTASEFNPAGKTVIFHCKGGNRTQVNATLLREKGGDKALILAGGIDAWKAAGLVTDKNTKQPIAIMRQVQIAAGALALLGAVLGAAVNPAFYVLSGAVGLGLMFSGITGSCAMAHALRMMPWNQMSS